MLKDLIVSLRPKQWYKNLVVFIGIVFSVNSLEIDLWGLSIATFFIFCVLSGSGYIINDILDVDRDRKHPNKCKRPIASGKISAKQALGFAGILISLCLASAYFIDTDMLITALIYLLLIIPYSLYLKRFTIVDVIIISAGFVVRAYAGAVAIDISATVWSIILTFMFAFLLGLGKRRQELVLLGNRASAHREALKGYSLKLLDPLMLLTIVVLIAVYSHYTVYTEYANNTYMPLTIPLTIGGLIRYLTLVRTSSDIGEEIEMIFKDKPMLLFMFSWFTSVVIILYTS